METGPFHGALSLGVPHERIPHKTGSRIFRHNHGDSGIDSDHIAVVPILQRVESINESVAAPGSRAILVLDRSQYARGLRQEWQGTRSRKAQ